MQNGGSGKFVFLIATFLALALVVSGAPVGTPCGNGNNPTVVPGGGDLQGTGCDFGDKTFSDLTATPAGVNVQLSQVGNVYTVTFFGNLTNSFVVDYNVAVNSGSAVITSVSAGIDLVNTSSTAALTKTVTSPGGPYVLTVDTTGAVATTAITPTTSLHVSDSFTAPGTGPGATSFSNSFEQGNITTGVPEPATVAMIGFGLLGIGFLGRRKLNRQ